MLNTAIGQDQALQPGSRRAGPGSNSAPRGKALGAAPQAQRVPSRDRRWLCSAARCTQRPDAAFSSNRECLDATLASHKDKPVYPMKKTMEKHSPENCLLRTPVLPVAPLIPCVWRCLKPCGKLTGVEQRGGRAGLCPSVRPSVPARAMFLEVLSVPFPSSESGAMCSPSRSQAPGQPAALLLLRVIFIPP